MNPLIMDQFTADPTARVFEGRLYVYPSHDILATPGKGRADWFCMEDYHVFSSADLTHWTDHGVILSQEDVPWVDAKAYAMWAPDCVERDGTYYFFFPAIAKDGKQRIGVATSPTPTGPFTPEPTPLDGVEGIDPGVFLDADGTAYLYYSLEAIHVAKLQDNLRALDGPPQRIANLPTKGHLEGPFVFEREGLYYLTYPHVENEIERIEYAMAKHPLGPFEPAGVIMDESPSGCWTIHQSVVQYEGDWYFFYHDRDLSPDFDKARSIRADRLYFEADGTIRQVVRTERGVGLVPAGDRLQLDRYSALSETGAKVSFIDPDNPFAGWQVTLEGEAAWVRFNEVDFGAGGQATVEARALTHSGAMVEIRLDHPDRPVLARLELGASDHWNTVQSPVEHAPSGVHDLFVHLRAGEVSLDWLRFE